MNNFVLTGAKNPHKIFPREHFHGEVHYCFIPSRYKHNFKRSDIITHGELLKFQSSLLFCFNEILVGRFCFNFSFSNKFFTWRRILHFINWNSDSSYAIQKSRTVEHEFIIEKLTSEAAWYSMWWIFFDILCCWIQKTWLKNEKSNFLFFMNEFILCWHSNYSIPKLQNSIYHVKNWR